jgi:hypothetical protein
MTARAVQAHRQNWVPDDAVKWVEAHIPAGANVFLNSRFDDPLPTPQCADRLWQEEMNNDAAVKKFRSGLARFHLPETEIPRALSEENMSDERFVRRGWFILGSRSWITDPRYEIHLYQESRLFTPDDPVPEFSKIGGVLIWPLDPIPGLHPVVQWTNSQGKGTFIYCSPDVLRHLIP